MSSELLHHCIGRLSETPRPRRLVIHHPLSTSTKISFTRQWAKARFEVQQESIIRLHPDHPDYGLGHLLHYELQWTETLTDPELWNLCICHTTEPGLSPRELILYATTTTTLEVPFNVVIFTSTKNRMLGMDNFRKGGSVFPALRPAVANVLWETRGGHNYVRAWNMAEDITTED